MSRAVFSLKILLSGDDHQEHIFAGISWNSDQVEPKLFCWIITSWVQYLDSSIYSEEFVKFKISRNSQENTSVGVSVLLKKGTRHSCFPVNFAKFLKTPFFIDHLRWLLLYTFPSERKTKTNLSWNPSAEMHAICNEFNL